MAEILGLGMSHFGGFMIPDRDMASRARARLADGSLPESLDDPSKWPQPMRAEWGDDEGAAFASRHRDAYFAGLDRIRDALDAFAPDAVVIFGDDQYECFREDLVPPVRVYLADSFQVEPYLRARAIGGEDTNIWNDRRDAAVTHRGAPDIARFLRRVDGAGLRPGLQLPPAAPGRARPRLRQHAARSGPPAPRNDVAGRTWTQSLTASATPSAGSTSFWTYTPGKWDPKMAKKPRDTVEELESGTRMRDWINVWFSIDHSWRLDQFVRH